MSVSTLDFLHKWQRKEREILEHIAKIDFAKALFQLDKACTSSINQTD